MQFDTQQRAAIDAGSDPSSRVVAITGAAGTGKTTCIQKIYERVRASGKTIALAAPTGKAAKRITESTGIEALTLHRLLEYPHPGARNEDGTPKNPGFPSRDRKNPLSFDMVLVDEYSMVHQELHRNLMDALRNGSMLRAVGDINQLRPIEASDNLRKMPTPFETLLTRFVGIKLEHVYRQGEGSGILDNAQQILKGRTPKRYSDFTLKITDQPVRCLQDAVMEALDMGHDYTQIENQIIVPGRKTWVGTHKLNAMLQSMFREEHNGWIDLPRHDWEKDMSVRVRQLDKVIVTENNYDLGVFNGEVGIVEDAAPDGTITINLGDRIVSFPPEIERTWNGRTSWIDPRKGLDLAYALTTHKMQGSECRRLIYVLNKSSIYNQNRANFYTAVTRARERVHLITDQRSLSYSTSFKG